jgi:acetyl esterase/lipase
MQFDREIAEALAERGGLPAPGKAPQPSHDLLRTLRALPPRVAFSPAPAPGVVRDEITIAGTNDAPEVPVRVHRPERAGSEPAAGLLWLHAGGYVLGSRDMDAPFLDRMVAQTGCVALAVDYRLAPETPYPGAFEDCFAVLQFLAGHAQELGVSASRIAVGGLSAGGGLAAALALAARDAAIPLVHQHLLSPMLDDRLASPSSNWDLLAVWPREMNEFAWNCYLGDLRGSSVPEYAAPARASRLTELAPAYIHVGALDGFLHENIEYAARLLEARVPTELHVFPGAPHGFDVVAPQAAVTKRASLISEDVLRRVLKA